jgi:hypothetical protein
VRLTFQSAVDLQPLTVHGEVISRSESTLELLAARASVPVLLDAIRSLPVADVTIEPLGLEDAFLEHYR